MSIALLYKYLTHIEPSYRFFKNEVSCILFGISWFCKHTIILTKNRYHLPFPILIVAFNCLTHYIHRAILNSILLVGIFL